MTDGEWPLFGEMLVYSRGLELVGNRLFRMRNASTALMDAVREERFACNFSCAASPTVTKRAAQAINRQARPHRG